MSLGRFSGRGSFDTSSLDNSDKDHSPLESWLGNYDSSYPGTANAGTVSSSLSSAFSRPIYTQPTLFEPRSLSGLFRYSRDSSSYDRSTQSLNPPEISLSLLNHESRGWGLANSYTQVTYALTYLIQTPSQIIGNYNVPTLNLALTGTPRELERLPGLRPFSSPPIQPTQSSTPIDTKFWLMTENATSWQLDRVISHLVSKLNWDFFASSFSTLNRTSNATTEQEWRTNIIPVYEAYIALKTQGNEGAFS